MTVDRDTKALINMFDRHSYDPHMSAMHFIMFAPPGIMETFLDLVLAISGQSGYHASVAQTDRERLLYTNLAALARNFDPGEPGN